MLDEHTFPENDPISAGDGPEPLDSWRLDIQRLPADKDWEEARQGIHYWWGKMRQGRPGDHWAALGGVFVRGGRARFVFASGGGRPARFKVFVERNHQLDLDGQLEFDFALPEDREKYKVAVDVMICLLGGADDSWTSHREALLALPFEEF
ncbi:hypothetical protein BO82DRAFT_365398 [Aspergillus uvarum CBS 121591]|uniref:Uncharacterized protein n=1 Tax=Aspergillus uvarum CBS 121591 TaxID=1448315 RepID=A0A319C6K2_9EURO|nr:hypothetical protein BO82DRAFT_365398 [Aspergillus uvarum CBS 121591]PYH80945.1 hypothetical protein BO82DRAFT_365398 [Aspergillus uvarum CBS 121591]